MKAVRKKRPHRLFLGRKLKMNAHNIYDKRVAGVTVICISWLHLGQLLEHFIAYCTLQSVIIVSYSLVIGSPIVVY